MKFFYDTSVLLASFMEDHEHHENSLRAFLKSEKRQGFCSAHSLAELYAIATRLPGKHRLSGEQVLLFLGNIRERLSVVTLTGEEYFAALKDAAGAGVSGGTVYDALLAQCALKVNADAIYTWNVKHFQKLSPDIAKRVRAP